MDLSRLHDELDTAIGDPPPPSYATPDLLRRGRRAVRRRRLLTGAAGAVGVVVLVGGAVAVGTGDPAPRTAVDPAAVPSATPTVEPTPAALPVVYGIPDRLAGRSNTAAVAYGPDGTLYVAEGAVVERLTENPYAVAPPGASAALVVDRDGQRLWVAIVLDAADGSRSFEREAGSDDAFDAWVVRNATLVDDPDVGDTPGQERDDLVRLDDDRLVAQPGVTLVEQRADPDVNEDFAAVAAVDAPDGRWFVLARVLDGRTQYIAVPADVGGADLDAFLDFARAAYASGSGLL